MTLETETDTLDLVCFLCNAMRHQQCTLPCTEMQAIHAYNSACFCHAQINFLDAAVFSAVSPHWAFKFLIDHGHNGWVMLGGVLLCVTGAEAMYADLGHFTRVSIQASCIIGNFYSAFRLRRLPSDPVRVRNHWS